MDATLTTHLNYGTVPPLLQDGDPHAFTGDVGEGLDGWQAWAEPVLGGRCMWAASFSSSVPHDLVAAFTGPSVPPPRSCAGSSRRAPRTDSCGLRPSDSPGGCGRRAGGRAGNPQDAFLGAAHAAGRRVLVVDDGGLLAGGYGALGTPRTVDAAPELTVSGIKRIAAAGPLAIPVLNLARSQVKSRPDQAQPTASRPYKRGIRGRSGGQQHPEPVRVRGQRIAVGRPERAQRRGT
ncbi:DUF317 domain-containing protein, partial [Streptomyces sp. NPDC051132]|uniref:DUF317 domain-containing protein n=1 Tax=Streptomyces sp. NPDC051132 TaxID=3155667 RepID=UPI00343D69D2